MVRLFFGFCQILIEIILTVRPEFEYTVICCKLPVLFLYVFFNIICTLLDQFVMSGVNCFCLIAFHSCSIFSSLGLVVSGIDIDVV